MEHENMRFTSNCHLYRGIQNDSIDYKSVSTNQNSMRIL